MGSWTAHLVTEWTGRSSDVGVWAEHVLAKFAAAGLPTAQAVAGGARLTFDVTVEAETLAIAFERVAVTLRDLGPGTIALLVSVGTPGEAIRAAIPELVGAAEAAGLLGVSSGRVSQLKRSETFPAPVASLAAGPVWTRASLLQWMARPGSHRRRNQT